MLGAGLAACGKAFSGGCETMRGSRKQSNSVIELNA